MRCSVSRAASGVEQRDYRWDIPLPEGARTMRCVTSRRVVPALIISPCSSHLLRNWHVAGYAAVGDHAARNLGLRVLICGGRTALEQRTARGDCRAHARALPPTS